MPNINWNELEFQYMPTKSNIRYTWSDGKWDDGALSTSSNVNLHIAASCLHYGQECFEGLKAFSCKDGAVRVFRPDENARRLSATSLHIMGPPIPEEMFLDAVRRVVKDNIEFIPPYGTQGSLYIRPLLIGTNPRIGISPSDEYLLIIMVMPVGPYYKGGITPVEALVMEDFDRAAPKGTGHVKVGGNYAAGLKPAKFAKSRGFPINLFLDSATHKYVDEFGTSNFIGITKDGTYVTPNSNSTLPSITNKSLMRLAEDMGVPVERRPIPVEELAELAEVGACGTAVVITPISRIVHGDREFSYGDECGPTLKRLYDAVTGIHYGELEDRHGWLFDIE
ncbi:MAG: branched-chain amino acid aminotransferase [Kiritimatiellaeota bacterium]|nr:branched-chain amino acid aminotransferase [Kiritimatiellota bacterium]